MKAILVLVFFGLITLSISSPRTPTKNVGDIVQIILAAMNTSVNPCDDFYAYSCGGWIGATVLPPDEDAIFKSISTIEDNNNVILQNILETQYNGSLKVDQRLLDLYNSCMNTTMINELGITPLNSFLSLPYFVEDVSSFIMAAADLVKYGFAPLFGFGPALDSKDPTITIAQLSQGGIALPDPSLYTDPDIMPLYIKHITNIFKLADFNSSATHAKNVVAFESAIAAGTTNADQLQNPFLTYNKIDLVGLQKIAPQIPWALFFKTLGYPNITQINVDVPSFYTKLAATVAQQTTSVLQSYLWWVTLHQAAPYLSQPFVDENFAFFGVVLQGLTEQPPLWETCVGVVDQFMGMLLGKYFVQVAFPGSSLAKASTMIQAIETAMHSNLETIPWMDNITRANALIKLGQVSNDIGYPQAFFTYQGLTIDPAQYFQNTMNAGFWQFIFNADQIQQPTNKDLWEMTPSTVNAYYDPTKNGMVFPAGILQSPFFDLTFAPAIYFGGSGVIMGHELTHGFDDSGRDYDGLGVLRNWWQPATSAKFDQLTACVIDQFSQFEVLPGIYVNGNLTQGENIADMGGTKLSYLALTALLGADGMKNTSVVPGMTNEVLYFVAYAQGWCSVQTPASLKIQVATDVHSPAKFRVLGPLINHPSFASVFNCPVGSFMNPVDKCAIW